MPLQMGTSMAGSKVESMDRCIELRLQKCLAHPFEFEFEFTRIKALCKIQKHIKSNFTEINQDTEISFP